MHVYGAKGRGKSDIVNKAASYILKRNRVRYDGALYVRAENKNSVSALIDKIGRRLSIRYP